jgi:Fic family protein
MLGRIVSVVWQGRPVEAFVPDPLGALAVELPERVVRATERALGSLRRSDERVSARYEALARLLLRAEGVASSFIEGVRAPAELVAVAEVDAESVDASSAWVADNLAVVDASLAHARSSAPLRLSDLHAWHGRLMVHGGLPSELVGRFRRTQGWVGGPTPRQAAYVPPPAEHVAELMRDLLRFLNRSSLDPLTVAAVAHAQFETIHPYGDGNGRLGRVLIGWTLVRHAHAGVVPPVSVVMARDVGGYLSGLTRYRQGDVAGWVAWMAEAVSRSADRVAAMVDGAEELRRSWDDLLAGVRADAAARKLLDVVIAHLVVTAPLAAELLGVSPPAARGAIETLAQRGILTPLELHPTRPGRPAQWWVAPDLVALVSRSSH